MTERIIPLYDARRIVAPMASGSSDAAHDAHVADRRGRRIHDLRISVTDRCNFRCTYCMPKDLFDKDYAFLPHGELLSFEEITRVARIFISLGVEKIRLTGGEPLLRKSIETLIEHLSVLRTPDGRPIDLTLTTNGSILAKKARALHAAGLKRVTVSLDALDDSVFRAMNDVDFPVDDVLAGIDAAAAVGMAPVKINMVVKKSVNDHQIIALARKFKASGHILRFIEFMDVGASNGWRLDDVVPSAEIRSRINAVFPIEPVTSNYDGEVAKRWRYCDGTGEIGFISSVSEAFCSTCTRARLSTDGKIYLCLFGDHGYDLRSLVRGDHSDAQITAAIAHLWRGRTDAYSEVRHAQTPGLKKVEMSYIGG